MNGVWFAVLSYDAVMRLYIYYIYMYILYKLYIYMCIYCIHCIYMYRVFKVRMGSAKFHVGNVFFTSCALCRMLLAVK